jgi:site-specific DNA recombinase
MRVAFYGRYSDDSQNEASIRQQFQIVRVWCKQHSHQLVAVYRDRGRSGENMQRPHMQRMLRDAERGKFDLIVTHKLNRFSRSLVDVILTINWLQNLQPKVLYASATEVFDCTSMIGRIILILLAFFAEWYLVELSAETTRGKHDRVANKKLQNNLPPFGYMYLGKDEPPEPDRTINQLAKDAKAHTPAAAMHRAFRMRVTDKRTGQMVAAHQITQQIRRHLHTDDDVAAWLNTQGYRSRKGNPFDADSVGDLLSNPYFAGWVREIGYAEGKTKAGKRKRKARRTAALIRGIHKPIVSQELFDLVDKARALHSHNPLGRSVNPGRVYWLGDRDGKLAVCSSCGRPMNCHVVYDRGEQLAYYCRSRRNGVDCDAPQSRVRQSLLAPQLDALMRALALPEIYENRIAELIDVDRELDAIQAEIAELDDQANRLDARLDMKRIGVEAYRVEMAEIQARIVEKRERLQRAGVVEQEVVIEQFKGLITLWESADDEDKRDVLQALLDHVQVDVAGKTITAFKPQTDFDFLFAASAQLEPVGEGWYALRPPNENGPGVEDDDDTETVNTEATGVGLRITVSRIALPDGSKPSYTWIARALGVSRQRAHQLVRAGLVSWRFEAGVLIVSWRKSRR